MGTGLERDRLLTLYRATCRAQDYSIALTAGLDDEAWLSHIMRHFAVTRSVPPGEYPSPIDELKLPYCGLMILHLDEPMPALIHAASTIQRCRPMLLVECKRGAQHGDLPGHFLARLGAGEFFRAGPDRIYGWAKSL